MTKINLKQSIMPILLILGCNVLYGQDYECDHDIKTGEFTALSEEGAEMDYKVKRTKNKQIEIAAGGKIKIISKIEWQNDTHYTLTTIKIVSKVPGCDKVGSVCYVAVSDCINGIQEYNWKQDGCGEGVIRLKKVK
jgi:hypothetical protein